jgi:pimeloyl-ACP methyl ester carboxylesterase
MTAPERDHAADPPAFLERDGRRLAYFARGDGPHVLFIQGVGVAGRGWRPQVDALAPGFRCSWFDNGGIGDSQPAPRAVTVAQMADDAEAVMAAQGWDSAHLVAHSLGGLVALEMALRSRESARSLSLICTFANGGDAAPAARMIWLGVRSRVGTRRMRRHAFLDIVAPPGQSNRAERDALAARLAPLFGHDLADHAPVEKAQLAALRSCDLSGRLGELAGLPTLVVSATHDLIAPPALGEALAAGIPDAQYVELADAAHGAPILSSAIVNGLLRDHLSRAERAFSLL